MKNSEMKNVILCLMSLPLFAFSQTGQLAGTVTDETNQPLEYAVIVLFQGDVFFTGVNTDDEGKYKIEHIPAGIYKLEVRDLIYKRTIEAVEIQSDTCLVLDIRVHNEGNSLDERILFDKPVFAPTSIAIVAVQDLAPGVGKIKGKVMGQNGEPLAFATIILYQDDKFINGARTYEKGQYTIDSIEIGTYLMEVRYLKGVKRIEEVEVKADQITVMDATFKDDEISPGVNIGCFIQPFDTPLFELNSPSGLQLDFNEIRRIAY